MTFLKRKQPPVADPVAEAEVKLADLRQRHDALVLELNKSEVEASRLQTEQRARLVNGIADDYAAAVVDGLLRVRAVRDEIAAVVAELDGEIAAAEARVATETELRDREREAARLTAVAAGLGPATTAYVGAAEALVKALAGANKFESSEVIGLLKAQAPQITRQVGLVGSQLCNDAAELRRPPRRPAVEQPAAPAIGPASHVRYRLPKGTFAA